VPKRFSTKKLTVLEKPTVHRPGVGVFEFTDDYSVFHFGAMPDQIPGKGEAICRMAAFNFELLARAGVPTHFRRFLPPNRIEFDLVLVQNPDVEPIRPGQRNYLVPLQVIFRNSLPPGNSLRRRMEQGVLTPADVGLDAIPADGATLPAPLIEFTTKLAEIDLFRTAEQAQALAGLDDGQFAELRALALRVDDVITAHAAEVGLGHADGKVEFAVGSDGGILLVDNAGTPDENRLTLDGFALGKQVLRDFYLARDLEGQVQRLAADGVPRARWPKPEPLPAGYLSPVADMYRSLCEAWTGERIWGAPPLDEVVATVRLLSTSAVAW
jgi:phosphoribosylaminoimidazole-succinocarboxamide synthase